MMSLSDKNQAAVVESFNSTSIYIDDLLNIDTPYFKQIVSQIHPRSLVLVIRLKREFKHYKRGGYIMDTMRQYACLVVNPITVYSYGFLYNCTTVG